MDSVYHISEKDYEERTEKEWPDGDERTLVATLADTVNPPDPPGAVILEAEPKNKEPNPADSIESESEEVVSETSAEGLEDDPLEMMRRDMEAEHEARLKKAKDRKAKRKPPRN